MMPAPELAEGQEVEVFKIITPPDYGRWCKATIVRGPLYQAPQDRYLVAFPDGTHDVFDAVHILASEEKVTK